MRNFYYLLSLGCLILGSTMPVSGAPKDAPKKPISTTSKKPAKPTPKKANAGSCPDGAGQDRDEKNQAKSCKTAKDCGHADPGVSLFCNGVEYTCDRWDLLTCSWWY